MRVIEAAGCLQVALNPITTAAMVKRISAVAVAERITLSPADAKTLAESANGDLRNALETLQLLCGGESAKSALLSKKVIATHNLETISQSSVWPPFAVVVACLLVLG